MKLNISILLILLTNLYFFGQSATIKDPDGWTNVREKPNSNSKILHKVFEGEFFFWTNSGFKESEWVKVFIPINKYSLEDKNADNPTIQGYIHRTRLFPTESIPKYKGDKFSFEYITQKFEPSEKKIKYSKNGIASINGRHIYGTDMSTPGRQVNKIIVKINNERIPIHKVFYEDIFECNNKFEVHKIGNLFIVNQWNSDGAGAYEIVWVLDKNGVKQRLVGSII